MPTLPNRRRHLIATKTPRGKETIGPSEERTSSKRRKQALNNTFPGMPAPTTILLVIAASTVLTVPAISKPVEIDRFSELCPEPTDVAECAGLPSTCCCEVVKGAHEDATARIVAKCFNVKYIPTRFPDVTEQITLSRTSIHALGQSSFNKTQLQHLNNFNLELDDQLESISARTFSGFLKLQYIYFDNVNNLIFISPSAFENLPHLTALSLKGTGLKQVEGFSGMRAAFLRSEITITFSHNQRLEVIQSKAFYNLSSTDFKLIIESNPRLKKVDKHAFLDSRVTKLSLDYNSALKNLHAGVFSGMKSIHSLSLRETSISDLPVEGLGNLAILDVSDTPKLVRFPTSSQLPDLHKAEVTYPAHCCSLNEQYGFGEVFQETDSLPDVPCEEDEDEVGTTEAGWEDSEAPSDSPFNDSFQMDADTSFNASYFDSEYNFDDFFASESFEEHPDPDRNKDLLLNWGATDSEASPESAAAGWKSEPVRVVNVSTKPKRRCYRGEDGKLRPLVHKNRIQCTPAPDSFNPCEDLLGDRGLIVISWAVALLAVFGNFFVILVLLVVAVDKSRTQQRHLTVPKFLILNLAFADFCMGLYVLALSAMDRRSAGQYYKYGVEWQAQGGCDVTGFLSVFSSQLSVYTLSVVSLERWYAIRYAIQLDKRMTLKCGRIIMLVGWLLALLFAVLPLVGVNSYTKTAVCLPMEVNTTSGKAYIAAILSLDIIAFLIVIGSYLWMYAIVRSANGRERGIKEFFKLQQKKPIDEVKSRASSGDGCYHAAADSRSADARVAKRMAVLVFTDFACFFPVCFFSLFALAGLPLLSMSTAKILLVACYPFNACCNPFLYAILTKSFRKDARAFYKTHKYSLHGDDRQKASRPTEKRSEAGSRQEERRKTIQVYVDGEAECASTDHKGAPHSHSRSGATLRTPNKDVKTTYATCSFSRHAHDTPKSPEKKTSLPNGNAQSCNANINNNNNTDSSASCDDVIQQRRDVIRVVSAATESPSPQRVAISKRLAMLAVLRDFPAFKRRKRGAGAKGGVPAAAPGQRQTQVGSNGAVILCECGKGATATAPLKGGEDGAHEMTTFNVKTTHPEMDLRVEQVVGDGESYI